MTIQRILVQKKLFHHCKQIESQKKHAALLNLMAIHFIQLLQEACIPVKWFPSGTITEFVLRQSFSSFVKSVENNVHTIIVTVSAKI